MAKFLLIFDKSLLQEGVVGINSNSKLNNDGHAFRDSSKLTFVPYVYTRFSVFFSGLLG